VLSELVSDELRKTSCLCQQQQQQQRQLGQCVVNDVVESSDCDTHDADDGSCSLTRSSPRCSQVHPPPV